MQVVYRPHSDPERFETTAVEDIFGDITILLLSFAKGCSVLTSQSSGHGMVNYFVLSDDHFIDSDKRVSDSFGQYV